MKITLAALSPPLIKAWKTFFGEEENVTIVKNDITLLACDAMVSPANSFGFMDGGLDYSLSERFGWNLEIHLQKIIKALPEGELLIGQALVVETGDSKVPYLISAPTMRIPSNYNIPTSINAYLAMKAILIQANNHPQIQSVAIPGLCTGVGKMKPMIAARQMYMAYQEIILGQRMNFRTFEEAQNYHLQLNPKGRIWKP
jgi:O-acetyl-ADP-ribose deacetylase (regulator of RNase III)